MERSLRDVRRERGLSQGYLAARAKMSVSLLCYAEGGRFHMSSAQAHRLAEARGVRVEDIAELAEATSQERGVRR